jgi:hypothetical protein
VETQNTYRVILNERFLHEFGTYPISKLAAKLRLSRVEGNGSPDEAHPTVIDHDMFLNGIL